MVAPDQVNRILAIIDDAVAKGMSRSDLNRNLSSMFSDIPFNDFQKANIQTYVEGRYPISQPEVPARPTIVVPGLYKTFAIMGICTGVILMVSGVYLLSRSNETVNHSNTANTTMNAATNKASANQYSQGPSSSPQQTKSKQMKPTGGRTTELRRPSPLHTVDSKTGETTGSNIAIVKRGATSNRISINRPFQ